MKNTLVLKSVGGANGYVLPARKYWCGDPCYVYPDANWSHFCDTLWQQDGAHLMRFGELHFVVAPTAYGDGEYDLRRANKKIASLGVDAGLLSIIPMELVKQWQAIDASTSANLGKQITLAQASVFEYNNGNITIGPYDVATNY